MDYKAAETLLISSNSFTLMELPASEGLPSPKEPSPLISELFHPSALGWHTLFSLPALESTTDSQGCEDVKSNPLHPRYPQPG